MFILTVDDVLCLIFVRQIQRHEVVLDDTDVARALLDFLKQSTIDIMVLGAAVKGGIFR